MNKGCTASWGGDGGLMNEGQHHTCSPIKIKVQRQAPRMLVGVTGSPPPPFLCSSSHSHTDSHSHTLCRSFATPLPLLLPPTSLPLLSHPHAHTSLTHGPHYACGGSSTVSSSGSVSLALILLRGVRGRFHVNTGSFSRKRISIRIPFVS